MEQEPASRIYRACTFVTMKAQTQTQQQQIKFVASVDGGESVLELFGDITQYWWDGMSLQQLTYDLYGKTGPLRVKLNSAGGDLLEAVAMANTLKGYAGTVTVEVIGLAASAATVIMAGANKVEVSKGAFVMIHNPLTIAGGNADQLEKDAETLRKMEDEMAAIYLSEVKKRNKMNGQTDEQMTAVIKEKMAAETWLSAADAVAFGLADSVIDVAASTVSAAQGSKFYAQFKHAPAMEHIPNDNTMAKGLFAALGDLFAKYAATADGDAPEQPAAAETPETPEPVQAAEMSVEMTDEEMKAKLEAKGFKVEQAAEETPETEKTYTEAEVVAAVEKRFAEAKAAKPIARGDGGTPPNPTAALKNKIAAQFGGLTKALKP